MRESARSFSSVSLASQRKNQFPATLKTSLLGPEPRLTQAGNYRLNRRPVQEFGSFSVPI
jgi:hypothetical protein